MSFAPFNARRKIGARGMIVCALGGVVVLAALRIHFEAQATLLGYEVARLKNEEGRLLEERSALEMQLSKLTTKQHLILMSETQEDTQKARPSYASK